MAALVLIAGQMWAASCARPGNKRAEIPTEPAESLEILAEDAPDPQADDQVQAFPPASDPIRRGACGIPLAVSIEAMFQDEGIQIVQRALIQRGLLSKDARVPGELDSATLEAIAELQRANDLPVVGLPTYATLRLLDIEPDEVLRTGDPRCDKAI